MTKPRRSRGARAARIPVTKAGLRAQALKPIPASESFRQLFANAYAAMMEQMNQVAAIGYKDHGVDPTKYTYDAQSGCFVPKVAAPPVQAKPPCPKCGVPMQSAAHRCEDYRKGK